MNMAVREQQYLFSGTDHPDVKVNRVLENPSKDTFTIPSIKKLIQRYCGNGKGWADPFSGIYSPAEFTNDINPLKPTKFHMTAEDFSAHIQGPFGGVLFDPPYSPRQIKECYDGMGLAVHMRDTQAGFYSRVKNLIAPKIQTGGIRHFVWMVYARIRNDAWF